MYECRMSRNGDVIFLNKIIKIKQFDIDDRILRYDILTTDNYYTSYYTRTKNYFDLIKTIKL